jgi:hypothetical protein
VVSVVLTCEDDAIAQIIRRFGIDIDRYMEDRFLNSLRCDGTAGAFQEPNQVKLKSKLFIQSSR